MEQFYTLTTNKKILLTASSSGLYAHYFQNEHFLRSSLLCSNYECGLSCTRYNDALYYVYINREHTLLLRCVGESSLQFRLDGTEAISYHSPRLVVFGGFLLLLYFECTDGAYQLRIRTPFADRPPLPLPSALPASFAGLPVFRILTSEKHLYLLLSADAASFLFRYTAAFAPEVLGSEEELLTQSRILWEAENTELNTRLQQTKQRTAELQELLTEKETKLQILRTLLAEKEANLHRIRNQLAECETARREALQNLMHTSGLLERAKVQYEELMQIALQYKEEAAKWYGKFTDRH